MQQSRLGVSGQGSFLVTVDRALHVLGFFSVAAPQWGVSELARASGLDKSQVQRLLATLAGRGFLVVDPVTSRYQLGPRLVALGRLAEEGAGVTRMVRPLLVELARTCGESAVFCQADGADYRVVAAADGPGPLRYTSVVGERFPGYGGGSGGDAIFAHYDEGRLRPLFGDPPQRRDDRPGETFAALMGRYTGIRANGYAVSYGDYDPRVTAVGVPVRAQGAVVGSVTVLGPREEVRAGLDDIVAATKATAEELGTLYETGVQPVPRSPMQA